MDDRTAERLARLEVQMDLAKWLLGILLSLTVTLGLKVFHLL